MSSFDGDVDPEVEAELAEAFEQSADSTDDPSRGRSGGRTEPRRSLSDRLGTLRSAASRWPRPDLGGWIRRSKSQPMPTKATPENKPSTKKVAGKTRYVIADDDAPRPSRSEAPIGRARFRERRIAVRRAAGRRRLRWVVVLGVVVVVGLVLLVLLASPLLSIRRVQVEGVVYADPERVGAVVASLKGDPILTADLRGAERELEAIPWVKRARVSMHLPSLVQIEVAEREPMAFYRAVDGFNRVIDIDGRVLDVIEGDPVDYPPIRGTGPNLSPGELVGQPFLGGVELLNALPRDMRQRVTALAISPEGEISVLLTDDVTVLFGLPENFQDKLVAVVNEIKRQGSRSYSVIDVSTGEPSVR